MKLLKSAEFYKWLLFFVLCAEWRLLFIDAAPLWYDEAGSAWMASLPLARLLEATAADVHPPLQMLLISPLVQLFGMSEMAVRLPSVLASLSSVYLLYRLAKRLNLSDTGTAFALWLMALLPFQLFFAQEARMYALLQMFVLGMACAMFERKPVWFAVCAILACYTHNYGVLYTATIGIVYFARELTEPDAQPQNVFLSGIVSVLAYLPWAFVVIGVQMRDYAADWIEPVSAGSLLYSLTQLFFPVLTGSNAALFVITSLLSLVMMFGALGVTVMRARHITLVTLVLLPLALAVTLSLFWRPMLLWRGLIGIAPFIYLLIGVTLADSRAALIRWSAVLVLPLALAVTQYFSTLQNVKIGKFDVRQVAQYINAHWREGDVIVHVNSGTLMSMHRYNLGKPEYLLPKGERTMGALTSRTMSAMGMVERNWESINADRVWLVWSAGTLSPQSEDETVDLILRSRLNTEIASYSDEFSESGAWLLFAPRLAVGMR